MSEETVTMSDAVKTILSRTGSAELVSPQGLEWSAEELCGTLAARFERVVRTFPDVVAVQSDGRAVTYAELNRDVNRIAHAVLARLGRRNVPVASLLNDRLRVVQVMMALVKTGHIYTPLMPEQPAPRLRQLLDDAEPPLVLVNAEQMGLAAQLGLPPEQLLNLDELDAGLSDADPCVPVPPESFLFIIYTSGSTGRPKGVAGRHGVLLSILGGHKPTRITPVGQRSLLIASPGYVAGLGGILYYLLLAVSLHIIALEEHGLAGLARYLVDEQIATFGMTASTFRHFMATLSPSDRFPAMRWVSVFGEPVLRKDFELFKRHFPSSARFTTGLGSTEAGGLSALELGPESIVTERVLPVGYPSSSGREVYIVDEDGRRVPPGTAGEIVVSSAELGEYWRDPERNARAFVPDPHVSGRKIFRTGDLGRLRPDGMLEHHGRKDFQVKIRGNRVELGEIEMALFELEQIREAVVVARPDAAGEMQLVAYVVPDSAPSLSSGGAAPAAGETGALVSSGYLRRRLSESLPAFMLPAAFVILSELPLTVSGKIDRAQLPAPDLLRSASAAARDALEEQLVRMWAELLHVPAVGIDDNFFDLGGNSLLAMRLFADIQTMLGRTLPLSVLFEAGTIAELAALIRADTGAGAGEGCLVPIQPRGRRRPFFLAAGGLGGDAELLIYARLARQLGADQPFYGLRARAVSRGRDANAEVEAIAAGHLAEIRAIQPSGPYLLGGECIGGMVAVEMARQLRAQGEEVGLLCLLDTVRPTWRTRLGGQRLLLARGWRDAVLAARALRHPELRRRRPRPDQSYGEAIGRYRTRGPVGRLTLLINEEYHRSNPTLGWGSLARSIAVHPLPGTHDSYIRQNVETTGACLRACLDRAQSQDRSAFSPSR